MRPYSSIRLRRARRLPPLPTIRRLTLDEAMQRMMTTGQATAPSEMTPESVKTICAANVGVYDSLPRIVRQAVSNSKFGFPPALAAKLLATGMTPQQVVLEMYEREARLERRLAQEEGRT